MPSKHQEGSQRGMISSPSPRRQLMMRKRCPQKDVTPHSLSTVLKPFSNRIQAKDRLSAASVAGLHAWGPMLPTSTRTPGVCFAWAVAIRYDPLCVLLKETQTWRIGTHTLGGVEGLAGGYQFVHWQRPCGEVLYARATDLACVIKDVLTHCVTLKAMKARCWQCQPGMKKNILSLPPGISEATLKSKFNLLPLRQAAQQ